MTYDPRLRRHDERKGCALPSGMPISWRLRLPAAGVAAQRVGNRRKGEALPLIVAAQPLLRPRSQSRNGERDYLPRQRRIHYHLQKNSDVLLLSDQRFASVL